MFDTIYTSPRIGFCKHLCDTQLHMAILDEETSLVV